MITWYSASIPRRPDYADQAEPGIGSDSEHDPMRNTRVRLQSNILSYSIQTKEMRTTIACERCRKSKVKCKHNGQPPCTSCSKTGRSATCLLSGPVTGTKRPRLSTEQDDTTPISSEQTIAQAFSQIPRPKLIKAVNIFQAQFPDFGFIHPDDLEYHDQHVDHVKSLWYLAITAVSNRYMETPVDSTLLEIITREVNIRLTTSPSLPLVHVILILSLSNWGDGDGFSAWMHSGMAARMTQGLLSTGLSSHGRGTLSELEKRTMWTCFVMDKLLSCGTRRQAMFHDKLHIALPIDDIEYALGRHTQTATLQFGLSSAFRLLIEGLNIWSRIHSWTAEGGRRQPGMTEPEQCPWVKTSQWAQMRRDLLRWRESQSCCIRYPETKTSAHAHLGQAEKFGYINLIYYVSLLFLDREYIPFAPAGETTARGPIESPLLKAIAPPDFWTNNLAEIFDSSTQISNLLQDLEHVGSPLHTPFSGLCAFSSALRAIYAAAFPAFSGFDQAQVEATEAQAERTIQHLGKISKVWKIAEEWLDVLNTAKNLFRRVTLTNASKPVKRSRYDYPDLEDSIHLGPLRGMPKPAFARPESTSVSVGPGTEQLVAPAQTGQDEMSFMSAFEGGNEFLDSDGWKLLSFWDDPHLLSTTPDPSF